jgi:hypothetical protein
MAKARRGRRRTARPRDPDAGGGGREHWRSDGAPKTAFRSADEANRAALQVRLEHGVDVDPYTCGICGLWHLGSRRD